MQPIGCSSEVALPAAWPLQVMLALVYLVLVIFVGFTITLTILKEDVHEYGMGLGSNHYYQARLHAFLLL